MPGFSSTGFEVKTLEEILDEVAQEQIDSISEELDNGPESPLGHINASHANQDVKLWELGQEAYAACVPSQASGQALDDVCSITGTLRDPATYSQVNCNCTLAAGAYAAGALVAHPTGDPTARFANVAEVVSPGGLVSGILFRAEDTGPVRANAGTLTVIAQAVSGWTTVTNPLDAALGALAESDTALRQKRELELARRGSTTVDAIRADVLDVSGVTYCTVLENDTDATTANGPPHSIQCVVEGGADAVVAAAIWGSKAAGITAYGSDSENVTDSQGYVRAVGFTRPTTVTVYLNISLTADADTYVGDAALKTALAEWGDENHSIGDDVIRSRVIAAVFELAGGVIDVTVLQIGTTEGGEVSANLTIAATERADFDTGGTRIQITSTLV